MAVYTTPTEDVIALRWAISDLLHSAPYDDMLWPEMLAALQLAAHDVKLTFARYHGYDGAPPPDWLPPKPEAPPEVAR